jgi:hypothetical protein
MARFQLLKLSRPRFGIKRKREFECLKPFKWKRTFTTYKLTLLIILFLSSNKSLQCHEFQ